MFIGSVYFASVGNHILLFLIFSSPFIILILFLGFVALGQFSLLIFDFFYKAFESKVVGIIAVITIYIIAILALIYYTQYG
jgi:hypothetical protein